MMLILIFLASISTACIQLGAQAKHPDFAVNKMPEIRPKWRETSQDSEGPSRWGPTMGQWKWDLNLPNLDQIHKSEDGSENSSGEILHG